MMTFALYESNELSDFGNNFEIASSLKLSRFNAEPNPVKILDSKISVPQLSAVIERPRLFSYLEKSLSQFSATLVTGRAGTGKTALAADFARQSGCAVAWYKTETSDSDWVVFLGYFSESLNRIDNHPADFIKYLKQSTESEAAQATDFLTARIAEIGEEKPLLIVLDDLHSVFDADWFTEFFKILVQTPMPNVHLLMTARAAPPCQLWRFRSKHLLGVVEESALAFTPEETIRLFARYGLGAKAARAACKTSYGNIAKLIQIVREKSSNRE